MSDFPLITAALRNASRFTKAIAIAREAEAAGQITNPLFQDIKTIVNRTLEDAWHTLVDEPFVYAGRWETLPPDVRQFAFDLGLAPDLRSLASRTRQITACRLQHPMIEAMRAFVTEAAPLPRLFETLKTMIVKRQPKPVEDHKAKYNAPSASQGTIGQVKGLLEQITEASYAALKDRLAERMQGLLDRYLNAQRVARADGKILPVSAFYEYSNTRARNYNPDAYDVVSKLTITDVGYRGNAKEVTVRPDAAEIISRVATAEADSIREMFIDKNLTKLDSILEAKGNYVRGEIIGHTIELGALRGRLRFWFADGAVFTVQNNVVWSTSIHGRNFNRFPLTFHDVVLPGGTKMARPSEERMNTLFVGKAHA